jgi:hypothetical protein
VIDRVGGALLTRLAAVVPPGFTLSFTAGILNIYDPNGTGGGFGIGPLIEDREDLILDQEEWEELLRAPLWSALSHAQDMVAEWTTDPWPAKARRPRGATSLPTPEVLRVDGGFRLFFGSPDDPVLELPMITDEELGLTD